LSTSSRRRAFVALVAVFALLMAACGEADDSSIEEATTIAGETTTTTDDGGSETATTAAPASTTSAPQAAARSFEEQVAAAAEAMLEGGAMNGATAVHVAVSDPEQGDVTVVRGTLSNAGDEAASEEDVFPIGSITKTFTATVILQMIEDGDLSLDDTVGELRPDLAADQPDLAGLTVQQLLTMTSGIEDYLNVPDSVMTEIVADPARVWEPEELIAAGVSPPGTPGYSTTNSSCCS
jgi:D-alanyl-D-alanine carboxypeptidase